MKEKAKKKVEETVGKGERDMGEVLRRGWRKK